jgi:hypothetical protein
MTIFTSSGVEESKNPHLGTSSSLPFLESTCRGFNNSLKFEPLNQPMLDDMRPEMYCENAGNKKYD